MGTQDLQASKELRKAGEVLGREGLAKRALEIAAEIIANDTYKGAINGVGKMQALARACSFDSYWSEKRDLGFNEEAWYLTNKLAATSAERKP